MSVTHRESCSLLKIDLLLKLGFLIVKFIRCLRLVDVPTAVVIIIIIIFIISTIFTCQQYKCSSKLIALSFFILTLADWTDPWSILRHPDTMIIHYDCKCRPNL